MTKSPYDLLNDTEVKRQVYATVPCEMLLQTSQHFDEFSRACRAEERVNGLSFRVDFPGAIPSRYACSFAPFENMLGSDNIVPMHLFVAHSPESCVEFDGDSLGFMHLTYPQVLLQTSTGDTGWLCAHAITVRAWRNDVTVELKA